MSALSADIFSCYMYVFPLGGLELMAEREKLVYSVRPRNVVAVNRTFLADRTIGRAFATARRLSVCLSVCL